MATNKEAKVKFTAETSEFSKGITDINKSLGNLKSDLKLLNTEIKTNGATFDNLSQKQKTLQDVVGDLSEKLELQQKKLAKAKEIYGEGSAEVDKLYKACNNTKGELIKFTSELNQTETALKQMGDEATDTAGDVDKLDNQLDEVEGSSGGLKGALSGLKDSFMGGEGGAVALGTALGNLASQAITACVDALKDFCGYLWDLPEATEEFRMNMAKLEGATEQYGYSADATKEKIKEMYGYFSDEQVATNAITNLQGLGLSQSELNGLLDAGVGVWTAYGDSIPIESLTESFNETAQVGKVTGALADALNWAGISEDDFNAKLESCKTTQERAKLITDTMNQAYGESKKTFDENTESIRASNEAQFELMDTEAKLAEIIEPLKTNFEEFKNNALEAMVPIVEKVVEGFNKFCDWCGQLKDEFDELRNTEAGQFFEKLLEIVGSVVWESIKLTFEGLKLAVEGVVEVFQILAEVLDPVFETINDFIDTVKPVFDAFVEGFKTGIEDVKETIEPVKEAFNGIKDALTEVFDVLADTGLFSIFTDEMSGAEEGAESLGEILGGAVLDSINSVAAAFIIASGVIQGLVAVIKPFIQILTGDFEGAMDSFKEIPGKLSDICSNTKGQLDDLAWSSEKSAKDMADGVNEGFDSIDDELPVDNLSKSMKKGMDDTKKETDTGLGNIGSLLTGFDPFWKINKPDTKDAEGEGDSLISKLKTKLTGWKESWKINKPDSKDAAGEGDSLISKLKTKLTGFKPSWKINKPTTNEANSEGDSLINKLKTKLTGFKPSWKINKPTTNEASSEGDSLINKLKTKLTGFKPSWKINKPATTEATKEGDSLVSKLKSKLTGFKPSWSIPKPSSKIDISSTLSTITNKLKQFKPSWSIPKPSLPKFSATLTWTTKTVLGKKFKYPSGIKWNALGGIFTRPTVLATNAGLQGFGEAGHEAILPLDSFYNHLDRKLDSINGGGSTVVNINFDNVQIKDDRSIEDLANQLAFHIQRKTRF